MINDVLAGGGGSKGEMFFACFMNEHMAIKGLKIQGLKLPSYITMHLMEAEYGGTRGEAEV